MRIDGINRREYTGPGPREVLEIARVRGNVFSDNVIDPFMCASLFQHPLLLFNSQAGNFEYGSTSQRVT